MSTSTSRRVAAVAAAALSVGGLVPVLAATSAAAAEPTAITVSPTSQIVDAGSAASFTATLSGSGTITPTHSVYYRVTDGPDKTTGTAGTACTLTGLEALCSLTGATAGTDSIQVFYDAAGVGGFYQAGDPNATASVTFAGAYTQATVSPSTNKVATNSAASFTVKGVDVNGTPASGSIPVTITETFPTASAPAANPLVFSDPTVTAFPATGTAGAAGTVSGSNTVFTNTTTVTLSKGQAVVGVASAAAGTVTVTAGANTSTTNAGTASLAVSAGNSSSTASTANDDNASKVALVTASSTSFTGKTVTEKVTVTNAAGDALGGVSVLGAVTGGPSKDATVTSSGTTDQLGQATLSYTAAATAGTDNVQVWVNQDTHNPNTAGVDAGEPQATGTVTLVAALTNATITANPATATLQLGQSTTPVTFNLKAGTTPAAVAKMTLDFALDPASVANGVKLSSTSGVTDASGNASVNVTVATPVDAQQITVTATLHGDSAVPAATSVLTYAKSAATTTTVTPEFQTVSANSTGTVIKESVKVVDNFGAPVVNSPVSWVVSGRNGPQTNPSSTGSGVTDASGVYSFSYTDAGAATTTPATDIITINTATGPYNATVNYLAGTATTKTLTLTGGTTTGTSANPVAPATAPVVDITAYATDNTPDALQNKAVTFAFTGAGTFADVNGAPIAGNSQTVYTDVNGKAVVHVRSTSTGTQTITATSDGVTSSPAQVVVTYTNQYVAINPERVADTRTGQGAISVFNGGTAPAKLAPNTNYYFNIGATNLPWGAQAYAFNVTAIGATNVGNLRMGPSCTEGSSNTPDTSLINYQPGKDVANFVVLPAGCEGFVIYSDNSAVSVAIDAVGYYPNADGITTSTPTRVVDTRTGLGGSTGPVVGGAAARVFQVTTDGAKAVALNLTAINPSGLGNLRVYPDGAAMPTTSNVNYIPGVDKSAFVIVNVPASGKIDVYSEGGSADVAIDLFATVPSSSNLVTSTPVRIADTRNGAAIPAGGTFNVQVTGKAGVPADAQAVLVSVTGIHTVGSTGIGNLRVFPAGGAVPTVSTLNYVSSTTDVANFAIVKIGANGQITLFSDGSPINAAVDVLGYVPAGTSAS